MPHIASKEGGGGAPPPLSRTNGGGELRVVELEGGGGGRARIPPPFPYRRQWLHSGRAWRGVVRWATAPPTRGAEDAHCGFGGGATARCVDYIGGVTGGEARLRRTCGVEYDAACGWCWGVELEGGGGAQAVERGWQLGRPRGFTSFRSTRPPPLPLPSNESELWRKRVSGWVDSLVGLVASAVSPSSFSASPSHDHVWSSLTVQGPKLRRR
jgi:hypothetical protein